RSSDLLEWLGAQVPDDRQNELNAFFVGWQPFLFEELAELFAVVGTDAEDVQRFEQVDVPGPFQRRGEGCTHAALEAHAVTLQPHTAAEELDDLRALAAPNVHQSHGAHTPAAPALGELLRTNEHVDGGVRLVQLVEQRSGKFPLGN